MFKPENRDRVVRAALLLQMAERALYQAAGEMVRAHGGCLSDDWRDINDAVTVVHNWSLATTLVPR